MSIGIGTDSKCKCILKIGDPYRSAGSPETLLHVIHDSSNDTGVLIFWRRLNTRLHLTVFGVGLLAFLAGFGVCYLLLVL